MEIKANTSRILMSDTLKEHLPDLESDAIDRLQDQYVHVIADRRMKGSLAPLAGLLVSVLFDVNPEIEIRVELSEALKTVKAEQLVFNDFELQHGDETVSIPGPFKVKAARIQDIDPLNQTSVLSMQLQRVQ